MCPTGECLTSSDSRPTILRCCRTRHTCSSRERHAGTARADVVVVITDKRQGSGPKLLLVHGLGSSSGTWRTIDRALAAHREVIALDLPGHAGTPAESDSGTFNGLVRSVSEYLAANNLVGVDMVGASLGGRVVLELARRGLAGNVVALDPGGFWKGWEKDYFRLTIGASGGLLRFLRPVLPALSRNVVSRTLLLLQLSAKPWDLDAVLVSNELRLLASTPTFDALVRDLVDGETQVGPAAPNTGRIAIGWGRKDRLCLTSQAARAMNQFPSATLHWFDDCGHFPGWDQPEQTTALILATTRADTTP